MIIAPPTFPKLFQKDIHLNRSTAILQATRRLIQANPRQESVNRVNQSVNQSVNRPISPSTHAFLLHFTQHTTFDLKYIALPKEF